MQTNIDKALKNTHAGLEAERILRSCVHCGFCTATCPTYRLLGDELDGPRGRIYLIKGLLEGKETSDKTQMHLDRCLTCLACETSCPSGVEYGHLLDIGRQLINKKVRRTLTEQSYRYLLRKILPYPRRVSFFLRLGRGLRFILPGKFRQMIPENKRIRRTESSRRRVKYGRKMILFAGCVQPLLSPETNCASTNILNRLGIETILSHGETCCGAINHHMADDDSGLSFVKNNIDAWWPYIEEGVEAIVISASGCGTMIKDLSRITGVVKNLLVYPDNMLKNLNKLGGVVNSQRVMLALTQAGVLREDAYKIVQENAMRVWKEGGNLLDYLKEDKKVMASLGEDKLTALFDLGYHTKHVDTIFKRVFG